MITIPFPHRDPKTMDDLAEHVFKPTVKLTNKEDEDGNPVVEWVQPCPAIRWAGDLNRDRGFLVNSQSETRDKLSVTVHNVEPGSFSSKKLNGRLENVNFKYRKVGSLYWTKALTVDKDGVDQPMDFAGDIVIDGEIENSYGYATLDWNIEPRLVKQGMYEVMVEAVCTKLPGAPSELNKYETEVLSGVIDFKPPKQYGEALPLREEIIPGEEIVVVFDEALDCSKPFSFDVQMTIQDFSTPLSNDHLQITCEGRKIGFQINKSLGIIQFDDIVGKTFDVEIGRIGDDSPDDNYLYDVNGNPLEYNVEFSRSFANVNLSSASTSFRLLVSNYPCKKESFMVRDGDGISKDIANEIASAAGLTDSSRITMHDVSCRSDQRVTAKVHIAPAPESHEGSGSVRKLKNDAANTAVGILYKILDIDIDSSHDHGENTIRMLGGNSSLSFKISDVELLPSDEDVEKYQTHPDNKVKESMLYRIASTLEHSLETLDGSILTTDLILDEMKQERAEMKQERAEMKQERDDMEKKLNRLQKSIDKSSAHEKEDMSAAIDEIKEIERMFLYSCVVMVGCLGIAVMTCLHLRG